MRVMVISHRFPPDAVAGVERYTQTLAADLAARGDAVSILTRRPTPGDPQCLRERLPDGTPVYRLTGRNKRETFLFQTEEIERLFDEVLQEEAPEVVHLNHVIDLSPRFIDIAHRRGAAVVLSLHDYYFACPNVILRKSSGEQCGGPDGGRECARSCFSDEGEAAPARWGTRTAYYRRMLAMAERVVCVSQYVATFFEGFGVDPSRLRVVSNGILVDPAERPAPVHTPRERGALNLATLGAVLPHKGIHTIIDAVRIAQLPAVDLAVFGPLGDPNYARQLRALAAAVPGLRLRLYGAYEPEDLSVLLRDVDCVLAPSQWPETFLLVSREAMVRGIPVVVTRLGALPDAVVEGENGFCVAHDRPEELAGILRRLDGEEDLLRQLRDGARRTRVLTVSEHVSQVRSVYLEAMTDFARGGAARPGDVAEVSFLYGALVDLGFRGGGKCA